MSNANRDYAIVYDVKNSLLVLSRPLIFYITDKNTSNIFVKLVTRVIVGNGIDQYTDIENASSYVLTMRVIKPDDEVKSIIATQHESESIFQFDLTEDFKDVPGKYICELTISNIVNGRQEFTTSDPFNYEVKRSILSKVNIIEGEGTTVEKLLNDLDATKAELSSQIKEKANFNYVDEQISKAQLEGAGVDTSVFLTKSEFFNSKPDEKFGFELNINQEGIWEEGSLDENNNGLPATSKFPRLRTKKYIDAEGVVKVKGTIFIFKYNRDDSFIGMDTLENNNEIYMFKKDKNYKLVYKNDNNDEINNVEILNNILLLKYPSAYNISNISFWERGSLDDNNGLPLNETILRNTRLRTRDFVTYEDIKSITINDGYDAYVFVYDLSGIFKYNTLINESIKLVKGNLYKMILMKKDRSNMSINEYINVSTNKYYGDNNVLHCNGLWVQGYFTDDGEYSDNTGSVYYNKRIVTKDFIDIKNINRVICETPISACYYQYDNNNNFVYRSLYSDILDIPDCSNNYKYKLQLKDATEKNITVDVTNKIKFANRKINTIYNKSCEFAPIDINGFYTGLQSDYSLFNRETTTEFYYEKLNELITQSNSYITKEVLGKDSSNTYDIYKLILSPTEYKHDTLLRRNIPHIIIISGQHGFEKSAPYALYYFMKDLVENWDKNPILEYLRFNCKMTILPIANPWGFDRLIYENSNNVNINRNYNLNFEAKGSGTSPLSEVETQYIASIIDGNRDAIYLADFHNNGSTSLESNKYINWHSHLLTGDPVHDSLRYASKYQIENISRHFKKIYGIDKDICGYMDYAPLSEGSPTCQGYATTHGIIAQTFEGFNGFAGREHFNGETAKANSELIGNWLITVLLHYKKFYDID